MRTFSCVGLVLLIAAAAWIGGCTSSQDPVSTPAEDGEAVFDGSVDPAGSSFVLQRIEQPTPPDVAPVYVELIGSNLVVDAANEFVDLDVAVRNASGLALYPPARIWVGRFQPSGVSVVNADLAGDPAGALAQGFDYSALLGEDGVLAAGETSEAKTWRFHVPDLAPFSFAARAEFSLVPDRAHIAGVVFFDVNADGILDERDERWPGAHLTLAGPDSLQQRTLSDERGRYAFHVAEAGLYRVTVHPMFLASGPTGCFTTPNPLEVLLTPRPDGEPNSFDEAHFGYTQGPCPPPLGPVVLTDLNPGDIEQDPYHLMEIVLVGDVLWLHIEFSGCQPIHPETLYISTGFMESEPVQTWALLAHDDLDEFCRVPAWQRWVAFDLQPLREEYENVYGHPGEIIVRFRDYLGEEHRVLFGP